MKPVYALFILGLVLGATMMPAASTAAQQAGKAPPESAPGDSCLVLSAENIVSGAGNWYIYVRFSSASHTIQSGDRLEYDVLMPALNPMLKGGLDAALSRTNLPDRLKDRPWLRDQRLKDQTGLSLHGDAILEPAKDAWYHRTFDLSPLAGVSIERWDVVFESDQPGRYVQFLDNIRITRDGTTVLNLYENGPPPEIEVQGCEGYSRKVLIAAVPHQDASSGQRAAEILDLARKENEATTARDQFRSEIDVARDLARRLKDDAILAAIEEAAALEDQNAFEQRKIDDYFESLHRARQKIGHAHSQMQKFTGHLVGHAHIDLQWLWTWDETLDKIIPETFGQAVKFMQEFPDFTFTQSSPALYLATEQRHPDLFAQIQQREKAGQWEIVGGRWCEGDMNMISPESQARHLLYGQRYFQNRFGHICDVGWEPDTFGHPWTMPQILKKGGIDYYYFCRAGKGVPLFWWESPDGSRVLAFEEPATGGWYNDVVSDEKVRELARFILGTGGLDHLMVYGVGNHGGGPTREYIQAALAMRNRNPWPGIKFSTAAEFFHRLSKQTAQMNIPTIRGELNPVFDGCYTTHSRIKKYNRDSESLLESAEVFTSLAGLFGRTYPREAFESMWRDVLWNHHHDTLPGSFIHASALESARIYEALLDRGRGILDRTQTELASRIKLPGDGPHVVVFNPLAWARSEVVETRVTMPASAEGVTIREPAGDVPVQVLRRRVDGDTAVLDVCFVARNVPGCGMKAFSVRAGASQTALPGEPPPTGMRDPRFWILHEKPHGMTAWTVGDFERTTELDKPAATTVLEAGPVRWRVRDTYRWDKSTIVQETIRYADRRRVDFDTSVEWLQIGNKDAGGPMLKVAFNTDIWCDAAAYDIPFGDVSRPTDGRENVALKWCAVAGEGRNVAVLNDCKHAYDVKNGTIRLTLLRSSYDPDPTPDVGMHHMRYAVLPQDGTLDKAAVARAAWEFNKPMRAILVDRPNLDGATLAPAWSGCTVEPPDVVLTCLKRAEDNDDFIVRAYECAGMPAAAAFKLGFDAAAAVEVDLLERPMPEAGRLSLTGSTLAAEFKPYEIRTFRIRLKD